MAICQSPQVPLPAFTCSTESLWDDSVYEVIVDMKSPSVPVFNLGQPQPRSRSNSPGLRRHMGLSRATNMSSQVWADPGNLAVSRPPCPWPPLWSEPSDGNLRRLWGTLADSRPLCPVPPRPDTPGSNSRRSGHSGRFAASLPRAAQIQHNGTQSVGWAPLQPAQRWQYQVLSAEKPVGRL